MAGLQAQLSLPEWLAATEGLENRCPDPACTDGHAHATPKYHQSEYADPIARLLVIPKGGH